MFNISVITKYCKKYKKNYNLQKYIKYSKISKLPLINFDKDNKQPSNKKFNEHIDTFVNKLKENPNIDLKLFYQNLKTLIIKEKKDFNKFIFVKTTTHGYYQAYTNKIWVLKEDNFYSIYHELLHCASRKYNGNKLCVGFHKFIFDENKNKITTNIGRGLTEGYTALLENRYFGPMNRSKKNGYEIECYISSFIEIIVGKEEMEKLYFYADHTGLINNLKQFANIDDIYLFLNYLDEICNKHKKKINPTKSKRIYKYISCFLLRTYIFKIIMLYQKEIIDREQFEKLFDEFVEELSTNVITDDKNTYYLLTRELTDQILDEISETLDNKKIRLYN